MIIFNILLHELWNLKNLQFHTQVQGEPKHALKLLN